MRADNTNLRLASRKDQTGPGPEDFRWICNLSIRDLAPVLQAVAHAAHTGKRPDISHAAARLAGDALLERPTVDLDHIEKDLDRKASEYAINYFYVHDQSVLLFSQLYEHCKVGYEVCVKDAKKVAAWKYGYQP